MDYLMFIEGWPDYGSENYDISIMSLVRRLDRDFPIVYHAIGFTLYFMIRATLASI
jgi:hypothetical protein